MYYTLYKDKSTNKKKLFGKHTEKLMVGTAELESATSCMSSKRSNQLSYAPVNIQF